MNSELGVKPVHLEKAESMSVDAVWKVLENDQWESKQTLSEASGVDDQTLSLLFNFLDRYNFIEIQRTPEIRVRRRPGAASPTETFDLVRAMNRGLPVPLKPRRLAERIACRACGWRDLNSIAANEVECVRCCEKQWFALEIGDAIFQIIARAT